MNQPAAKTDTALYQQPMGTPELGREFGLSDEEYGKLLSMLGRTPNLTELGIVSVMWSEHCSYKTTRKHLGMLPTDAPHVICGPGENAGIVDIGDGLAAVFKMESHNHPSYIEPYQGAATGVGGILRDVFTMGARPIANLNALRFGDPSHPKTRHLVRGVVAGIGGYGNCVGVPTVGGECSFHPAYNGNILVNAMTVGLAETDKIFYAKPPSEAGLPVVYVGAKTGRDGIHGATMASAEFTDESEAKRPTVQVGDPFTEKRVLEACLELMAEDAILAIQDMGAAGLTSSSLEMGGKGGIGVTLHMERVPCREEGMTPYEMMLSESQERMLMILKPGKESVAERIFRKWELDIATIGETTDTGRLMLYMHGALAADLPIPPISTESPIYDRPHVPTPKQPELTAQQVEVLPVVAEKIADNHLESALLTLLATPDLGSKRWIWEQYDHQVMNDTLIGPGGDAAVLRVHGTKKGLAVSSDCTPRYVFADPVEGGKQAVAECWRNLISTGAKPLAITNCLNFGNPERPEIMGQLIGSLHGMRDACLALDFPVVSGNVSLYNETNGTGVLPTPSIGGVGLLQDASRRASPALRAEGLEIFLLGETKGWLGQSQYLRYIRGREEGAPPPVDLGCEYETGSFLRQLIENGQLAAAHDLSDGGVLIGLSEMCMGGNTGATVALPKDMPALAYAFGEDQGRYLIAAPSEQRNAIEKAAAEAEIALTYLGRTGGEELVVEGEFAIAVKRLRKAHESFLASYMDGVLN